MPIVALVDKLLENALRARASDIHIESQPTGLRVRYRVDGILCDQESIISDNAHQVIARIKVLARMDVSERRIPQDGKFAITHHNRDIDVRVASFPGLYGEKIVVRILDRPFEHASWNVLGIPQKLMDALHQLSVRSTGFFLVTGPTGSGKTTTLYTLLSALQSPEKNVVTLEDPIEYTIPGVTQGQIQPDIGFTFACGIRSLLRQDPDIIFVGEIRDRETAEVATQAALTGHVVLSTLHTNDAPGAVIRLMDMSVPAFLVNATLTGVLAQRLVRVLCDRCKVKRSPDDFERAFLLSHRRELPEVYHAVGCEQCAGRGYKGRTGIFELLVMTPTLREVITHAPVYDTLHEVALREGMTTLMADGIAKVEQGITTVHELARVIS